MIKGVVILMDSYVCPCLAKTGAHYRAKVFIQNSAWWVTVSCSNCGAEVSSPTPLQLLNINGTRENEKQLNEVITEAQRKVEPG